MTTRLEALEEAKKKWIQECIDDELSEPKPIEKLLYTIAFNDGWNACLANNKPIMTKQEMDDVFEAVKRGEINFNASFTIYTNRNGIGKHIVKEGLPKEEAQAICSTCNAEIKVPPHKDIKEMIGYMWYVEE